MEQFSYDKWYPLFKSYCFKSKFIPFTKELIEFLNQDSIIISEEEIDIIDSNTKQFFNICFIEYEYLFLKLNWSSGSDSYFLVEDLKLSKLEELLLILKGSSKLIKDYTNIIQNKLEIAPLLVVKKWYSLDVSKEFRCYFINNELKAIVNEIINTHTITKKSF